MNTQMNLAAKETFFCPWQKMDFKIKQRERGVGCGVSWDSWQRFFQLVNCLLFFTDSQDLGNNSAICKHLA